MAALDEFVLRTGSKWIVTITILINLQQEEVVKGNGRLTGKQLSKLLLSYSIFQTLLHISTKMLPALKC